MKTIKNHPPAPANAGLSPRDVALKKLFRFVIITAILSAIIGIAYFGTLYGDYLLDPSKWRKRKSVANLPVPKLNENKPPGDAPEGMVWVPGGEFWMGVDPEEFPGHPSQIEDSFEIHFVYVDGFWMDKTEVTNAQFAKFVAATKYVTDAEKTPTKEEFPKALPEDLKPFSIVFKKPQGRVDLRDHLSWWEMRVGANWKHPEGPGSTIEGRDNYPVVHVSYSDAVAYCKWADKRLPTEAEWEFGARGGLDRKMYPWGDELTPDGKWMTNVWQGNFPHENLKTDGHEGAAPVGSYPANKYGLHDMAGNVWEWCSDWYRAGYYKESPDKNPQGPRELGFDWNEPDLKKRVQRGGSYLCADNYCIRYVVGTRGKGEVTSAQNHCGFRCAKSAK